MSVQLDSNSPRTHYAVRGAVAFGLTALIVFALSAWYATMMGHAQFYYYLAAGPLCGMVGGLAYGRRVGLAIVLGITCGLVGAMFMLQDGRSTWLIDVVLTGFASAFLFWVVGGCATVTLPSEMRFNGANAFAIPGGLGGMAFQFVYGPAHSLFDLGKVAWWRDTPWEHLLLWLIVGIGGGWLFGAGLDRLHRPMESAAKISTTNRWAVASVVCGVFGLGIGVPYFLRDALPLGLLDGLSPASAAADWLRSWGVLVGFMGIIAFIQMSKNGAKRRGRAWAFVGIVLAATLVVASVRIEAAPWKTRFDTNYANRLLGDHAYSGDADNAYAIYKGNLILAQAALNSGDVASTGRYLLEAATARGVPNIEENGPDVSLARTLLQLGQSDAVLEYLDRCRGLWPQGTPVLARWETAIRAGRLPNFNNRAINPADGPPPNPVRVFQ